MKTPAGRTQTRLQKRIGKYLITGRIGQGGMGMVYRGYDEVLEREVAVKTLTAEANLDEESRRRFEIEAKAAARVQALCAMHFGDFAAAHEHLVKARAELPQRPGISQGTALYYRGLALERLGYKKEATEAYRAAAGQPGATLFNNDGPAVAPLAARRAGS